MLLARVFRDAGKVGLSVFVATTLLALRSVLVLEVVGPSVIGVWKSVVFLVFLSGFARLGMAQAIGLRVPMLRGQGRLEEANRLSAAAGTALALAGVAVGLVVLASSFLVADSQFRIALRFVSAVIVLSQVQDFFRELAGARHLFGPRSVEALIDAVTNFAATLILAHFFGLVGLGLSAILTALLALIYLGRRLRFRFVPKIDRAAVKELVRIGLPYSFMEASFHFTKYLGVPVVALLLGPTMAGYYALATLILEFSTNLTQFGVSRVLGAHLMTEFGRQGSHTEVARYYELPARLLSYTLPPVLMLITLALPVVVKALLPDYSEGIAAAQVAVWGILFLGVNLSLDSFLNAAGQVFAVLRVSLLLIPVGIAVHFLAIWAGFGITGVAAACVLTLGAHLTVKIWLARKQCNHSGADTVAFLASLYLPFLAALGILLAVHHLGISAAIPSLLGAPIEGLICLLLYAPLFFVYETHFSLVRGVYQGT